ncbi:iron-sulfur cluster assembly scaffold protein [Candidatus Poribacteria bacterium]|nr:iron-sulfur cluster assembly scaffold protein [Candidatus Poribacteria bacterium]
MHTPQVMEHYENPRNIGTIRDADGVGVVGTPASGEMMKLTIKVSQERVVDAKFKAFGCPTAIAASSLITELIKECTIQEALDITNRQVDEALGGLPPDKARYAVLAEKVLKAAIHNYNLHLNKKGGSR